MQLPRLTMRRLKRLVLISGGAMAVLAALARPGDEQLAAFGVVLIGLLDLATILPFLAYALKIGVPAPTPDHARRRPPRLPRLTTRRLLELILVVAFGFATAIVLGHRGARNPRVQHSPTAQTLPALPGTPPFTKSQ